MHIPRGDKGLRITQMVLNQQQVASELMGFSVMKAQINVRLPHMCLFVEEITIIQLNTGLEAPFL